MRIARHQVDRERIENVFRSNQEDLDESLLLARKHANALYLFFRQAETVSVTGAIIDPDSSEVARALRLAAQAGTALFAFQRIEDPSKTLTLGEGAAVGYTEPAGPNCADYLTWVKVFHLCAITRERQLSDELCLVPNEVFRHADIVGAADADYSFCDLLRVVWSQERFTHEAAFTRVEIQALERAAGRAPAAAHVRRMTLPLLESLRCLERRDQTGFATALTEALQGHKDFWSQKQFRKEFDGFVSLELISVASLAWDRGMRFEVESDYLPNSWVRGDLFRAR